MIDWLKSMNQTFEYYVVDPGTWKDSKKLDTVKSCTITRDAEAETLGSATIDVTDLIEESYIRVYLVAVQNGVTSRYSLGTFLVQTPSSSFDGKKRDSSLDAYTPLIELKENPPPLGYSILKNENILDNAYLLCREHVRAPVVKTSSDDKLYNDFIANTDDTWMSFLNDLLANAKYYFDLDEMGRVLFAPKQDTASLQPVWEFNDDTSSILYSDLSMEHDYYGIPNIVEVVYSKGNDFYYAKVVNDDENSPTSTVNRGREILHRVNNPGFAGEPTKKQIEEYARQTLKTLSAVEYTITYTHGYCPVRVGDCVRLNYSRAGVNGVKARVISQSIKCESGCPVTEKAVFTMKLWGDDSWT
jgi:hypothetical protein